MGKSPIHVAIEHFSKMDNRVYYTVAQAAPMVGKSIDTLVRWRKAKHNDAPSMQIRMGQRDVFLYTEDDIAELKEFAVTMTPGRRTDLE